MSIQNYKQCVGCGRIILPEATKMPYADGSMCFPCYLRQFPEQMLQNYNIKNRSGIASPEIIKESLWELAK